MSGSKLPSGRFFRFLSGIGSRPEDDEELKLQKSLLVLCAIPFILAGAAWGAMYVSSGEVNAGLIPLSYSAFSLASLVYFGISKKFLVFRFSQLVLILLLPFALMLSLGGYINGSAVIIWSLISPLGAMLFYRQHSAPRWLMAYLVLVVAALLLQPWLRQENSLSPLQIGIFFVINLGAVGAIIFLMVFYFVSMKNRFQQKSEALLLNILPRSIAEELKQKGNAEARQFEEVSVLFTDFKDFTSIAEKMSPVVLVAEIDHLFRNFDRIMDKHGLEKIKTIGDAYMCAGGLPVPNATHAQDTVAAGLDILAFMQAYAKQRVASGLLPFEIRIGIHTGTVVAGIVGEKKFAYDIWGDAVNTAARMESSGEAGKVNISGATYERVKDLYHCRYRGRIEAKHKGEIDMYFVEGPVGA